MNGPGGGGPPVAFKTSIDTKFPVLDVQWMDNASVAVASAGKSVQLWNLQKATSVVVGGHDAPIKSLRKFWMGQQPMLVSGGWDKCIKYWDQRQPGKAREVKLPERVYTMDAKGRTLVVGLAERQIGIFDLQAPDRPRREMRSPLNYQTRCISVASDGLGFILGSIEGRASINYVDAAHDDKRRFQFRCHRVDNNAFPVNTVDMQPGDRFRDAFVTTGADGSFVFWDKEKRVRLANPFMHPRNLPVTTARWSPNGALLAYAHGYDWHMGMRGFKPAEQPVSIHVHPVADKELTYVDAGRGY